MQQAFDGRAKGFTQHYISSIDDQGFDIPPRLMFCKWVHGIDNDGVGLMFVDVYGNHVESVLFDDEWLRAICGR